MGGKGVASLLVKETKHGKNCACLIFNGELKCFSPCICNRKFDGLCYTRY